MRTGLFLVVVLVVDLAARGGPGVRLSAGQIKAPIIGAAECVQDFPSAASPDARATVLMCGLDNPRGLAFGPEGSLYVAEAGRGGFGLRPEDVDCFTAQRCYGATGAISRLWNGVQEAVATGLPSHANPQGLQAIGPTHIALIGVPYVTIGLQQPPAIREQFPFLADFARLIQVLPTGKWRSIADLGAYEAETDPDRDAYDPATPGAPPRPRPDSNPYGLLATPSGREFLVADAGGNSLLHVAANGDVSTYAVFKPHREGTRQRDAVPTSVELGPDGAYYVGELTALPPTAGAANIYRIASAGTPPTVCLSGFSLIIDLTFDGDGNLYVLQHSTVPVQQTSPGVVIRVQPDLTQSDICGQYQAGTRTTVVGGLTRPTSVLAGPDGAQYLSNRGTSPGIGQVIRIDPSALQH